MKIKDIYGREVSTSIERYRIEWEKKISIPQKKVKDFFYDSWRFDEVLEEFRIPATRLRIDLLNISRKIAVEVSPKSSHSYNKFFHGERVGGFLASVERDIKKKEWVELAGFKYLLISDENAIESEIIKSGIEL